MADSVYEELMGKRTEGLDVPQVRIKDTVEQTTGRDTAYDELMGKPKTKKMMDQLLIWWYTQEERLI